MTRNAITAGQRIVEILKNEGVECIFSQGELSLKDIQKHALNAGIKMVGPHHEASGVWMAAAYYRMTGKVQVAMGAQGPGVANMLPAVVWAAEEHIPIIIIGASRQHEVTSGIRRGRFLHAESLSGCFKEICKFAHRIYHPRQVDEVLQTAFRQALTGTPGPVYVEVDYAGQMEQWDYEDLKNPEQYRVLNQPAADSVIDKATSMIKKATSLLLIGGDEIHSTRTYDQFHNLARALGCPVITTFGGAGAIKQTDPQWLPYSSKAGQEAIGESDVVLAVGTCIPENLNYGKQRCFVEGNKHRKWIQIDPDPSAIAINRHIDLAIIGSLNSTVEQLTKHLNSGEKIAKHPKMSEWRKSYEIEKAQRNSTITDDVPLNPKKLMLEAREAVPDDAVIVSDSGFTIVYQDDCFEKRCNDFIWGSFAAHLGTGLPQAIGAQLAVGNKRPVCLLSGDGGLGMHIMELETAIRHKLPVVVVLNDDQAFAAELEALNVYMGKMPETMFVDVRYDQIVESMGGHGEYVETADAIQPAIKRAFQSGKTAVVQIKSDQKSGLKYPPFGGGELFSWVHEDVAVMKGN